ncbi:hypothetical protein E2P81_ATG10280 [Venturia nashicola]|nr:hypothetical protein E2P81_ATG10280 [Venturia nashicola]
MASYIYRELDEDNGDPWANEATCKCCRLNSGVDLPAPRTMTVEQVQPLATNFAQQIYDDYTALRDLLMRHESTIRKRWLKKGANWRSKILLTAMPDIPLQHRADFEGYRNLNNRGVQRGRTCSAEAHLMPYINKEDLLHDRHLLLFLNSRGRNPPGVFTWTDAEKAHLALDWTDMNEPHTHSDSYMMVFCSTPRDYGMVVKSSEVSPKIARAHGFDPVYGLLVLEIQQKIYSFLLSCAKTILHDYSPDMLMSAPRQLEPTPLACDTIQDIGDHTLEADYRLPYEAANLGRLQLLVSSRRDVAEDHVLSLREDPGYFLDTLRAWREYFEDPDAKEPLSLDSWRQLASYMLANAFDSLYTWSWLAAHLAGMRPLNDQIASADPKTRRLTADDENKWAALVSSVHHMQSRPMANMRVAIPRSSGLRGGLHAPHDPERCKRGSKCPSPRGCDSLWNLKRGSSSAHHRVVLNFSMVSGVDTARLNLHGLRAVVQETNHMLENDDAARELIDPWLLSDFFDLAVLSDLEYCIAMFQPYSKSLPERYEMTYESSFNFGLSSIIISATANAGSEAHSLGDPLDGRFHYPAEKRRTAETVRQMQRAESALKAYWAEMAVCMHRHGIDLELMLEDRLSAYTPVSCKTQDWDEELATSMKSVRLVATQDEHCKVPSSTPSGKENRKTEISIEEKMKLKTRGSPQGKTTVAQDHQPAANDPVKDRQPIIVPRRIFKVMSALLPSDATISEASREISWKDLLFAFNAIGLVPEKLYGSVWIFQPLPGGKGLVNAKRSIQFHEPKSVRHGNKIDAQMVRRFGYRLKRVYGWDGETFVCA